MQTEATLFRVLDFNFAVAASSEDGRREIDNLFCDLIAADSAETQAVALFTVLCDSGSQDLRWQVLGPNTAPGLTASSSSEMLAQLMAAVSKSVLDAHPRYLHVHASAASRDDLAVIVAAERNTGKTTTVERLCDRGLDFITDDMVIVEGAAERIAGYPKPLSIKPDGRKWLAHLSDAMVPQDDLDSGYRFLPASAICERVVESASPHLVVLLRRENPDDQDRSPAHVELHPVDAVVQLMQETLDPERYVDALGTLSSLAARCRCVGLSAGTPSATAAYIEDLMVASKAEPFEVRHLPEGIGTTDRVRTVEIGDRAVVHNELTGTIFALDAAATRVWQKVGGWEPHPDIDLEGPVVRNFVLQLENLHVLTKRMRND